MWMMKIAESDSQFNGGLQKTFETQDSEKRIRKCAIVAENGMTKSKIKLSQIETRYKRRNCESLQKN